MAKGTKLAELVFKKRDKLDLSLRAAAADIGVEHTTLYRIEASVGLPSIPALNAVFEWLKVSDKNARVLLRDLAEFDHAA